MEWNFRHASPIIEAKTSGPFGLDMDFLKRIEESAPVRWKIPNLVEPSWDPNEGVNTLNPPPSTALVAKIISVLAGQDYDILFCR